MADALAPEHGGETASLTASSSSSSFYPDDEQRPAFVESQSLTPAPPSGPTGAASPFKPLSSHPPPPRRTVAAAPPRPETWAEWGTKQGAFVASKGLIVTDAIGGTLNGLSESVGSERWFPTTGDFPSELAKATRIFESFTIDGVATSGTKDGKKGAMLRKIPAQVIQDAKGICVYSCMRNGFPPFGGSNGSGVVVARLKDGSWSAPSSVSPNSSTAGFMVGVDSLSSSFGSLLSAEAFYIKPLVFDAVLIIRTEEAMLSFTSRAKLTLGTDFAVAAGPYGAGAAFDMTALKAPIISYVRSRGFYAGLHLSGQAFIERQSENESLYSYPGVRAADILEGKINIPYYSREHFTLLHQALYNAETGAAQRSKGGHAEEFQSFVRGDVSLALELADGERMRLPPTPEEVEREEKRLAAQEREKKTWLGWVGLRGKR